VTGCFASQSICKNIKKWIYVFANLSLRLLDVRLSTVEFNKILCVYLTNLLLFCLY